MAKVKIWTFTVFGQFEFPFDMLRYDRAWPASEIESSHMEAPNPRSTDWRTIRHVKLNSLNTPTAERWNSFGWGISAATPVTSREVTL
jgi:hypothetical protein